MLFGVYVSLSVLQPYTHKLRSHYYATTQPKQPNLWNPSVWAVKFQVVYVLWDSLGLQLCRLFSFRSLVSALVIDLTVLWWFSLGWLDPLVF